jgi:hypothetical protein
MNTKFLVGGLIGAILYFLLGWLVYGILLADFMNQYSNSACARPMEEMQMPFMIISNLGFGFLLSYIFSKWANITTFSGGAMAGATVAFLTSLSYDCGIYAMSTMMNNVMGVVVDVVLWTILSAIVGGVIGWWLGRK